jgi:hypothetical protein
MGAAPFKDLEVGFTEISPTRGYKYLLYLFCMGQGVPIPDKAVRKWQKPFCGKLFLSLDFP